MRCECGFESPDGFRFCGDCGATLIEGAGPFRAAGGSYTPPHLADRILRSRSALEGEHKQVTVLFVDVKHSMELAAALGAEEWHQTLDQLFRLLSASIHTFEGTVNQYTGDGLMALFGAPIAHEDHASRACHAALRITREAREFGDRFRASHGHDLGVRMGLNTGDVVVGRIGDDLRMDYTAQGHVVGLAARMEELSEPGQVLLTEAVARRVRGFFRIRELGVRQIAGVPEPLPVYALEGETEVRTRLGRAGIRLSPLVGRDEMLMSLDKAFSEVRLGSGLAVGVEGDPGVGKSRLCLEFARRSRDAGFPVVEVHCPSHAATLPRFALRELARACCGLSPDDPADALTEDLDRLGGADPERASCLIELLGLSGSAPAVRDPRATIAAVAALVLERAQRGPLLVLIDDLHWIDAESEALLEALVDGLESVPLLLLVNFRPEFRAGWMDGPLYRQLGLGPLDRRAGEALLKSLRSETDAKTRKRLLDRSAGNPLFLEELLQDDADGWTEVPASVRAVIAARLDRLDDRDKRVAQLAAVVGRRFREAVLKRVTGLEPAALSDSLAALQSAEIVHRETFYGDSHVFKHPLTREVAYGSLLSARRREAHASAAAALRDLEDRLGEHAGRIAQHWDEAGKPKEAAAWRRREALRVTNLVPRRTWHDRKRE